MANDVTRRRGTELSLDILKSIAAGIADSRSSTPIVGGKPFLRMSKSGRWIYGQSDERVQEGSEWAVSPVTILHGYVCWSNYDDPKAKNEKLGEVAVPITQKKPPRPEPINGFAFNDLYVFDLRCVHGDDKDVEVSYYASSVGSRRALDAFLARIVEQIATNPAFPMPIVQLGSDSYPHKKWGETFVPVVEIVDWADLDGNRLSDEGDEPAPAATAPAKTAAARSRKPVATAAAAAAAAWEGEEGEDGEPDEPVVPTRASAAPRRQRPADRA